MKSNEKKQTAVEWQFEQLFNSFEKFNNREYTFSEYLKVNLKIFEQAKEMEKKQIEEALLTGLVLWDVDKPREQYYKETYEK
jgi:hypothetical protein